MKRLWLVLVLLVVVIGCGDGSEVVTSTPSPPVSTLIEVITKGADRLVTTQNADGGWEWEYPDTDPVTGVPSPSNTVGVIAQGLLDAYKVTHNQSYLDACLKAYDLLVSNSASPVGSTHRIRGADINFLVELSEVTGDDRYAAFARDRYWATIDEFGDNTAIGFAVYIANARKQQGWGALISWDINLFVRGLLALDRYYPVYSFDVDAFDMTGVVYYVLYASPPFFDLSDTSQPGYWLSHTGAIEAFTITGTHLSRRDALVSALVASQLPNGSHEYDTQLTAYAVVALLKARRNVSAINGALYLIAIQSVNGGWVEDVTVTPQVENPEVTSEVIQALCTFVR